MALAHSIWRTSGNPPSQKHIRENVAVVVLGNSSVADYVRKYVSYDADIISKEGQNDVQKLLCKKLLGIDKELPIIIFLANNTLKGIAIGLPSETLWQKITEQLLLLQDKFLAVSMHVKDFPWHCKLCKDEENNIIEYLRTLSEEEETLIISIVMKDAP